nr:protein memo1 [Quercus suber]
MSKHQVVREASHAGSWYSASGSQLDSQLQGWLAAVKAPVQCIGPESNGQTLSELPGPGARLIIAPYVR